MRSLSLKVYFQSRIILSSETFSSSSTHGTALPNSASSWRRHSKTLTIQQHVLDSDSASFTPSHVKHMRRVNYHQKKLHEDAEQQPLQAKANRKAQQPPVSAALNSKHSTSTHTRFTHLAGMWRQYVSMGLQTITQLNQ